MSKRIAGIVLILSVIFIIILMAIIISNFYKSSVLFLCLILIYGFIFRRSKVNPKQVDELIESYDLEKVPSCWKLSLDDLKVRRKIWIALSDLFLDTQNGDSDAKLISEIIKNSDYSDELIQTILWYEVAPVVESNLVCIAGEWTAFSEKWLIYNIESKYLNVSGFKKMSLYVGQFIWRLFFFSVFGCMTWKDFISIREKKGL